MSEEQEKTQAAQGPQKDAREGYSHVSGHQNQRDFNPGTGRTQRPRIHATGQRPQYGASRVSTSKPADSGFRPEGFGAALDADQPRQQGGYQPRQGGYQPRQRVAINLAKAVTSPVSRVATSRVKAVISLAHVIMPRVAISPVSKANTNHASATTRRVAISPVSKANTNHASATTRRAVISLAVKVVMATTIVSRVATETASKVATAIVKAVTTTVRAATATTATVVSTTDRARVTTLMPSTA